MNPRLSGSLAVLTLVAALACAISSAGAAAVPVPAGPRLTLLRLSFEQRRSEVVTAASEALPGGAAPSLTPLFSASLRRHAQGPIPSLESAPAWSPDGETIAFAASGRGRQPQLLGIFSVAAAGGVPRPIPGTSGGFSPVFSPDGQTLAFARTRKRTAPDGQGGEKTIYESTTTWTTNLSTGATVRLTNWKNGVGIVPSSFSPDGSILAATKLTGSQIEASEEAVAIPSGGGHARLLIPNAGSPVYSPDGTRIAFQRGPIRTRKSRHGSTTARLTDLYTAAADASDTRRLTATPSTTEIEPSWDPSGQRLAFVRLRPFEGESAIFAGDEVAEVNADGTCVETLITDPKALLIGPAWQPGPGREAGPIIC